MRHLSKAGCVIHADVEVGKGGGQGGEQEMVVTTRQPPSSFGISSKPWWNLVMTFLILFSSPSPSETLSGLITSFG